LKTIQNRGRTSLIFIGDSLCRPHLFPRVALAIIGAILIAPFFLKSSVVMLYEPMVAILLILPSGEVSGMGEKG